MAPRYENYNKLAKDGAPYRRLNLIGLLVEWFLYLGLGMPRHGLNSLTAGDVSEVSLSGVTNTVTGVLHKVAILAVDIIDAELGLKMARLVVEKLEQIGLRVLDALPLGPPGRADHDLVVERTGARGRGSVELKLMQIGAPSVLADARKRHRTAAEQNVCWAGAPKNHTSKNGFVERFLVLWVCEPQQAGGTLEARLPKGKLRVDVLQYVKDLAESEGFAWNWIPFCGWQGFNLGNDIEAPPQPCLQSSSTAAQECSSVAVRTF